MTWVLKPDCPHSYLVSCHVSLRTLTFLGLSFLNRGACYMLICHLVSLILNELMFSIDLNWFHSETVLEAVCDYWMVAQVFCGDLRENGHLPWSRTKPTWFWLSAWIKITKERPFFGLSDPSMSALLITVRQGSPDLALFTSVPCVFYTHQCGRSFLLIDKHDFLTRERI